MTHASSVRRSGSIGIVFALVSIAVLVTGAILRAEVIVSIRSFFGPGDPAIYFQMGRATLLHGVPRVDFLHHFLTMPPAIQHIEDYYEPAFGFLLAAAMSVSGPTPAGAADWSLAISVVAMIWVWLSCRRDGGLAALLALGIVAFEPWTVLYGGLVMKEATVAAVLLGFLAAVRALLRSPGAGHTRAAWLAAVTVVAGLFQYELLPILGLAMVVTLALTRPRLVVAYALVLVLLVGVYAALTWWLVGVPITAKYAFFLGRPPGDPEPVRSARDLGSLLSGLPARLIAFDLLGRALLTSWYPMLLAVAILGAGSMERFERISTLAVTASLLYLHAVANDLWARDFIPLTVVLARPAALALTDPGSWWRRPWGLPAALGLSAFLYGAPPLFGRLGLGQGLSFWGHVGAALAGAAALALLVRACAGTRILRAAAALTPSLLALGLAWGFWTRLPYPEIYSNPQFPDYEIERARRERVCAWMKHTVPAGGVIARIPAEVSYDSGFPAVVMPESLRAGTLERLARRYDLRYLLVEPGSVPDSLLGDPALVPIGEREGIRLFAFRNSTRNSR